MNDATVPTILRDLILEERAAGRHVQIDRLLQIAHHRGIAVSWEDLREFSGREGITPGFISDFVAAYAAAREPEKLLDPWAGLEPS